MENYQRPVCPHCGKTLIKDGKRPGDRQKWKCKNKTCHYYETESAKTTSLKINAINFFIDFLYNSKNEVDAKKSKNIKLNFRKTRFKNDEKPELKFKNITDIRYVKEIDCSKCFIIQLKDKSTELISMRFADSEILFKNSNPNKSRKYKKEKVCKDTECNYRF